MAALDTQLNVDPIPVDEAEDLDSAYGSIEDTASETHTLESSVRNYIYENGRRYNSYQSGKYWRVSL
jgi:hypothetical protein